MSVAPNPIPVPADERAPRAPQRKPRRGDLIEVAVDGFAAGGGLRGRACDASGDYSVDLLRGVPGERLLARVSARRGQQLRARGLQVLSPSPHQATPRCSHFPDCGGCAHQDLDYAAQLEEKRAVARRLLATTGLIGRPGAPEVEPCLACASPWRYRNRMDFTYSPRRFVAAHEPEGAERGFALGLHPAGQFRKVVDVRACPIAFPEAESIVSSARELALSHALAPWDMRSRTGLLRHLVLRKSFARGEILASLVTSSDTPERVADYAAALLARHPEITTLVQTVNSGVAMVSTGEREVVLHGRGSIVEELGGFAFRLSARSFFQTNTPQAERLLELVLAAAAPQPGQVAFDLYCGAGTLTLPLASAAGEAFGFELVEESVADARANAERNGVEVARFLAGDVAATLAAPDLPRPQVVVADPPRGGLHPRVADALGHCEARRLVYVSCNLSSAARVCAALAHYGFALVRVQPIDMFPHTPHLECVLTLERRG